MTGGWTRWFPGVATARAYKLGWLPHDLFAGLALSAMLVPVGIAYAVASGLPGIYGLYATIVPLLAYALFGPSRILVLGADSALAPIILGVVLPLAAGDPGRAVALAGALAVVSGAICIVAGPRKARFRHRTPLQADPLRLHERHRLHRSRQPAPDAARHRHSRRRPGACALRHRAGGHGRTDELDGGRGRRRNPRRRSSCSSASRGSPRS